MLMRCKCDTNAMQCKCKCECKCKRKCNANAMQMQCNANANADATRCNTTRAMCILTINPRVELACAFAALFVKTQSMRCNVMQCHAMQSDRETQNHYATRFDTTRFACIFGITSHRNAIIFYVFLHIVFDTFLDRFWYQNPPQNLPTWSPNLGFPAFFFGFCDPWPPTPAQDGIKMT